MNYIKVAIIFLIFSLLVFFFYDFNLQNDTKNFNLEDTYVDKLNINVSNSLINIETTSQSDITIERIYSERSEENKKIYYEYSEADTEIYIGQYEVEDKVTRPNQTINIRIPESVDNLNVSLTGSNNQVTIDGVVLSTLNISDDEKSNISIANSSVNSTSLVADNLELNMNKVEGKNALIQATNINGVLSDMNMDQAAMLTKDGNITLNNNIINKCDIKGDSINIDMKLNKDKSYSIVSNTVIKSKVLELDDNNKYTYNKGDKSDQYNFITSGKVKVKE